MYEQRSYPKFFKLLYSLEQLKKCKDYDPSFIPNQCDDKEYTELKTGQTLEECNSNFEDAICIFSGTMQEYQQLEEDHKFVYL